MPLVWHIFAFDDSTAMRSGKKLHGEELTYGFIVCFIRNKKGVVDMGRYSIRCRMVSIVVGLCMAISGTFLAGSGQGIQVKAASGRPQLMRGTMYLNERSEDGSEFYLDAYHDSLRLTKESADAFPALNQALEDYRTDSEKKAKETANEYLEERKKNPENVLGEKVTYALQNQCFVRRADETVVSFLYADYSYAGGAHGNTVISSGNYDVHTGKELSFDDIVKDKDGLAEALEKELLDKYGEDTFFPELSQTLIKEVRQEDELKLTWVLDPQGVSFFFSPYEIGPYASGILCVTLSYASYGDLFTENFRPAESAGFGMEMLNYVPLDLDVDGDGEVDRISVDREYNEEGDVITGVEVRVNDQESPSAQGKGDLYYYSMRQMIFLSGDGKAWLYLIGLTDNDYSSMDIYDLSSGKAVYVDSVDMAASSYEVDGEDYSRCTAVLADPDLMPLTRRFDILSTYSGSKLFKLSADGLPESSDSYYLIDGQIQLKSRQDIRLDLVDEKGTVTKKNVRIPSGSTFDLYRTDGQKILDARLKDGSLVRFIVEGTYPPMIDGVNGEELFERLYYAG